jgi:hypothetical protein
MVKNKGGNKQKKLGRKHLSVSQDLKTRFSTSEEEIYACCTKIIGQGYFEVLCIDNINRLCIARKKFKGRSKRDNLINVGTKLLIGVRAYETKRKNKLEKCDLLEVYKEHNYNKIVQHETKYNWSIFNDVGIIDKYNNKNDSNIIFTIEEEEQNTSNPIKEDVTIEEDTTIEEDEEDEEDIDIDDI